MPASLAEALDLTDEPRVITRGKPPFAILHTNKAWSKLTGYKFTEVAYRTTAFLQGPDTEQDLLLKLQEACRAGQYAKVRVINYTKNGDPFVNNIEVHPMRNAEGILTHWCGVLHGEPAPQHHRPLAREHRCSAVTSSTSSAGSSTSSTPPVTSADWHLRGLPTLMPRMTSQQHGSLRLPLLQPRVGVARPEPTVPADMPAIHRPKRLRGDKMRIGDALDNTSDAVVLTQPHPPYKITHVNQPWVEMCGYTQEDVEGKTNSLLHGPETDQSILEGLMSAVSRGEPASASVYNYKKSGEKFLNQVQVMPVYNDEDELEQFMALLHEVDV
mmetsp:Transcript_20642/g.52550  ORF Transcript_20642/g.52550 Transcript_20642/m.52550 type:complete len:328 (+) Transcript_20642:58-1041(+)